MPKRVLMGLYNPTIGTVNSGIVNDLLTIRPCRISARTPKRIKKNGAPRDTAR